MAFNGRLKELREKKGILQANLADNLGVSKSATSMYERGERNPDFVTLDSITDYLNVDMNYLHCKEDCSVYWLEQDAAEIAQELYDCPEMKVLFDASQKATSYRDTQK